ncbi:MAG: autotransporter domain-containing protein [Gammaproteobacteria bacterium]|nr:autotransporter domain-containing protein [Gammaproteobacteria bacterium]
MDFGSQQRDTQSGNLVVNLDPELGKVEASITIGSITITGTNASEFSIEGGTCSVGGTVASGSSCSIDVSFQPASLGAKTASVELDVTSHSDQNRSFTVTGTGTLPPPAISSPLSTSGSVGSVFSYQIVASNSPTSYSATNLPAGLSINTSSGAITGTPSSSGSTTSVISAINAVGIDTENLAITIDLNAPVISSASTASGTTGQPFSYQITASSNPTSFGATDLPPGVTVNSSGGEISGTPTAGGSYNTTITATNTTGTATQSVGITITKVLPTSQGLSVAGSLNAPATIDLTSQLAGPSITAVRVETAPSHGSTSVNGKVVTYTPVTDYFGTDSFEYVAVNNDGDSAPSTVTITIAGRPSPAVDQEITQVVQGQVKASQQMTGTQISTFGRRMEGLHQTPASQSRKKPTLTYGQEEDVLPDLLSRLLHSAATTRTLELSYSSQRSASDAGSWIPDDIGFWIDGMIRYGNRNDQSETDRVVFSTDGISLGMDAKVSEELYIGGGIGYAQGESVVGEAGTRSDSSGYSLMLYGSHTPAPNRYIDGMVGVGNVKHEMLRHVAPTDAMAATERDTKQLFGSLTAGYQYEKPGLLLSPYLRYSISTDKMGSGSETGAGSYNLTYDGHTLTTQQFSLGLRAETTRNIRSGSITTHIRTEYSHDIADGERPEVFYADQTGGTRYQLSSSDQEKNMLLIGIGNDFLFRNGLKLELDYQVSHYSGSEYDQAFGLRLSRPIDQSVADIAPYQMQQKDIFAVPLSLQLGYSYDDNINRDFDRGGQLSDDVYNLRLGSGTMVPVSRHTRLLLLSHIEVRRHHHFNRLSRNSIGVAGEYQFRASGEYDAVTIGLNGKLSLDSYDSALRDGNRTSIGINARKAVTDRIYWFAQLSKNRSNTNSEVFDTEHDAIKLNIDYALRPKGALYLSTEYRRGDVISTHLEEPGVYPGSSYVEDDAFPDKVGVHYNAYKYGAKTTIWSLGYNLPIGSQDSIDFSWMNIKSTAEDSASGQTSYKTNQYSVYYLMKL